MYGGPIWHWAPFTYPPFATVVLTPLALLPLAVDEILVTSFGVIALFVVVALALRLPMGDGEQAPQTQQWRSVRLALAVAAGLWLEPITATLGYGQINLLKASMSSMKGRVMSSGVSRSLTFGMTDWAR